MAKEARVTYNCDNCGDGEPEPDFNRREQWRVLKRDFDTGGLRVVLLCPPCGEALEKQIDANLERSKNDALHSRHKAGPAYR